MIPSASPDAAAASCSIINSPSTRSPRLPSYPIDNFRHKGADHNLHEDHPARATALRLVALATIATLLIIGGADAGRAAAAAGDPPKIVPWSKIGDVAVGMLRTRVVYEYGASRPGSGGVSFGYYGVPGGRLNVTFRNERVVDISTTSPRYVAPSGVHVGTKIPLGRLTDGHYRWQGFTYASQPGGGVWVRFVKQSGRQVTVRLWVGAAPFMGTTYDRPPGVVAMIELTTFTPGIGD